MKLFMKIVQVENVKNETEAIIELLKIDKNMNKLNIIDYIDNKLKFVKLKIDDEKVLLIISSLFLSFLFLILLVKKIF